jgi:hypothetical protein
MDAGAAMTQRQWLGTLFGAVLLSSLFTALAAARFNAEERTRTGDRSGPQLNQALNHLMEEQNLDPLQATKVVPILSLRSGRSPTFGGYPGAAQVSGPAEQLEQVQAVALLEGTFSRSASGSSTSSSSNNSGTHTNSSARSTSSSTDLRALVPIAARSVTKARRVPGVGVSGLVDIRP